MRIRLPLGRTLFFLCAFVFALLALLPLRLALDWFALDERGLAAREAQGSIWLGRMSEVQFGAVALGDLQAQLRSLPLFVGQARVDLNRFDEDDPLEGSVSVSRHGFGVHDMRANLDAAMLFPPLPLASLELGDVTARFADGLCVDAEGIVKATLSGQVAGLSLPGGLSGNARCDGGALLLPLTSQSGMETLNLRLFEDSRYSLELIVRPTDPAVSQLLLQSGFQMVAGGSHMLKIDGEF